MDDHGTGAQQVLMLAVHSPGLVILSIFISVLGAYASVALIDRVNHAPSHTWGRWLLGTAVVDAIGTWSMHYTGKAALLLPVQIEFDWRIVLLSFLVGITGSTAALIVVTRQNKVSRVRIIVASLLLAVIGISGLHFTGMHAMRVPTMHHYSYSMVAASIVVPIGFVFASLSLNAFPLHSRWQQWQRHARVWFRGAANPAMHYTAMAGVILGVSPSTPMPAYSISVTTLSIVAITVVPIVVLIVGLLVSFVDRLRDDSARLQALSRRLVDLQEDERRRLARELHDRIGQGLTGLGINLDILRKMLPTDAKPEMYSRLEDSANLVETTVQAAENVMADLRPPMLDDAGLLPTLHWYAENFGRRTGINITVQGNDESKRLPSETEIGFFRIVQEALNNVAKHARATQVEITLKYETDRCFLLIRDNGVGFDSVESSNDQRRVGLGMATMKERAEALGGFLKIESMPGRGTTITVMTAS